MTDRSRRRFLTRAAAIAAAACAAPRILAAPSAGTRTRDLEAMEDALEILAKTGPEYAGRLANHGPMAAEALVKMGRPEAVVPWVESYRKRLRDHPASTRRIDPDDWRAALGDGPRVGDWIAFFDRALDESPWKEALGVWVPRLTPGVIAASFHGVIRTSHAVRSLEAEETPARRRELAEGLGYWAATYATLPESTPPKAGRLTPSKALAGLEPLPPDKRVTQGLINDRLRPLDAYAKFFGAADEVDVSGDASRFLSDLTLACAAVNRAPVLPGTVITFIHTVTGPSAVRRLLPYVDPAGRKALLRYTYQGVAGLFVSSGGRVVAPERGDALDREALVDRALATDDEHAIKFTEACLQEEAVAPAPDYRKAALVVIDRLG